MTAKANYQSTKCEESVSIVLCTYNGEKYVAQQIDTLLRQTYPISEIIIQDDHSTDHTMSILQDIAEKHPNVRIYSNESGRGVNSNFFSAMRRAKSQYIAICDQDDLWEPSKIERQMALIGDKMLCACRSRPFSDDGAAAGFDPRTPNCHLIRLLYSSIPGHTMLFHRHLLDLIPTPDDSLMTCYDVYLSLTAAAYGSLVLLDEVLVMQRRHPAAFTYAGSDPRRRPSASNGLYILAWSVCNYHRVRPYMIPYFERRRRLLGGIAAKNQLFDDAQLIISLQCKRGVLNFLRLSRLHIKYRHHLFYAEGSGWVNFFRALLYGVMQVYNYRYLCR